MYMCELVVKEDNNADSISLALPNTETEPIDILNRDQEVQRILDIIEKLSEMRSSAAFALNGKWGTGKTFVLDMLRRELMPYQDTDKYLVFHYNCWQYDYYEEPLFAIVSAMQESVNQLVHILSPEGNKKLQALLTTVLTTLAKAALRLIRSKTGVDIQEILSDYKDAKDNISAEDLDKFRFDNLHGFQQIIDSLRNDLTQLGEDQTLIVIVDELDRCLPEYAIKTLERLHHLFSGLENTIVILSVDREQLNHSVKSIFGDETDARAYLQKFINFEIPLSCGTVNNAFCEKYKGFLSQFVLSDYMSRENADGFFTNLFSGMEVRLQERIMERVATIHQLLPKAIARDYAFACFEVLLVFFNHIDVKPIKRLWIDERKFASWNLPEIPVQIKTFFEEKHRVNAVQLVLEYGSSYYKVDAERDPGQFVFLFAAYYERIYGNSIALRIKDDRNPDRFAADVKMLKMFDSLLDVIK